MWTLGLESRPSPSIRSQSSRGQRQKGEDAWADQSHPCRPSDTFVGMLINRAINLFKPTCLPSLEIIRVPAQQHLPWQSPPPTRLWALGPGLGSQGAGVCSLCSRVGRAVSDRLARQLALLCNSQCGPSGWRFRLMNLTHYARYQNTA